MFINDDGIKLHVELEKPENAKEKMPLVIVIHGLKHIWWLLRRHSENVVMQHCV